VASPRDIAHLVTNLFEHGRITPRSRERKPRVPWRKKMITLASATRFSPPQAAAYIMTRAHPKAVQESRQSLPIRRRLHRIISAGIRVGDGAK